MKFGKDFLFLFNAVEQCEFNETWWIESQNLLNGVHGILSTCIYFCFCLCKIRHTQLVAKIYLVIMIMIKIFVKIVAGKVLIFLFYLWILLRR